MSQSVTTIHLPSRWLGRQQPVSVIAPNRLTEDGRCYTIYLLHGTGGTNKSWSANSPIAELAAEIPAAIVMPSAENSYYLDSQVAAMESFLCDELVPEVDNLFPTIKSAKGRAVTGYSMGGYGALLLALRRPELFGTAASHSGAVLTARATTEVGIKWEQADDLYGIGREGQLKRRDHDILSLVQKYITVDPESGRERYTGPALYLDCGADDFLFYASRALTEAMRMLHIPYEYHEWPGDHNWEYWSTHLHDSLEFHLRQFASFHARPSS